MASKNDIFADLFSDFKSSNSSLNLSKQNDVKSTKSASTTSLQQTSDIPKKINTLSTESLPPRNINKQASKNNTPSTYSFDDIFVSDVPQRNTANRNDMFDDLLIPEFNSQPNGKKETSIANESTSTNGKKESSIIDDNPFETYSSESQSIIENNQLERDNSISKQERNIFVDMTEHIPHMSGVFTSSSSILEKGRSFLENQFASGSSDRLDNFEQATPQRKPTKMTRETIIEKEKSAPIVEDMMLLDIDDTSKKSVNKSAANLLSNNFSSSSQSPVPEGFTTNISNFEKESYFDFKAQGTEAFKVGHYDMALEKFKMASDAIPKNHIFQVIVLRNLISTTFKLGDLPAVKNYLDEVFSRLHLKNYESWSSYTITEKQPISLKDIMKKILLFNGDYYELKEDIQQASDTYKKMLDLGLSDHLIIKKKQRLEKVLNPKKFTPPKPSVPKTENKPKVIKLPKVTQEVDTTAIRAKVTKKIEVWQAEKATDLRYLLSCLETVLPSWNKLDPKNLISPKKCKIYYFKAINQTHPDKIQQNADAETKMLLETIFMTLNKAWVVFKEENDL